MKLLYTLLVSLSLVGVVYGQQEAIQGQEAYCRYVKEQAFSQRDFLRTPTAQAGFTQPDSGLAMMMVFGATNSLSKDRQASLTMKVASKECALYRASVNAQEHIIFALPGLEKDILRNRLTLVDSALSQLDALIAENAKMVDAGNVTRPAVYSLQSAKVRLDTSRTTTLTGIATPYVPPLDKTPIKVLVADKLAAEAANQTATAKLQKQSTWDVQLTVGAYHQILNPSSQIAPYGEAGVTWNLGSHSIHKHLDQSASAYTDWKEKQYDDVAHQSQILEQQIDETIKIDESQLKTLKAHDGEIATTLTSLEGVDTSAALTFKNQLLADRIVLAVDINDLAFRLNVLRQYLIDNF